MDRSDIPHLRLRSQHLTALRSNARMRSSAGLSLTRDEMRIAIESAGVDPGSWRRIIQKDDVVVETNLFRPLDLAALRLVRTAAERYAEFLGLQLRLE